jgi:outer membrane beta-barrel protein
LDPVFGLSRGLPPIEPEVKRRDVAIPKIDTELVEFGVYGGVLSVEDFGASYLWGGRANLRVTEQVFLEAIWGRSSVTDEAFRRHGINLFGVKSHQALDYYAALIGWDLFPGEIYIGDDRSLSSSAYVLAGAGNIQFMNEDYFNAAFGMGIRLMPRDWLSVRIEAVGFEYESTLLGFRKYSHNFASTVGLQLFF